MAEIASTTFSQVDGSNTGALPGLTGSSSPALIDNSIRALMGAIKREHDWRNFTITSSGSANAYVLTYSVAPAAYYTGQAFGFITNFAVTGSATVNVNTLGAKTIKKLVAGVKTNLASGDISSGDFVQIVYDGTDVILLNPAAGSYTVNGQTNETSVDTADSLGGYDASATAERKFTVNNVFKAVNTFTAETAVAVDDVLPLYDTSAGTADKATVQNVFKAINGLTEDTSPDTSADFVVTYDTSAGDVKKVKPSNLTSGAAPVYVGSAAANSTTSSITGIGQYTNFLIKFTAYGSTSTMSVAVSSNNGSSYGTAINIAPSLSGLSVATGTVTISNTKNAGANKVVTPYVVTAADIDTPGALSTYTTTGTETSVTGIINAVQFTVSATCSYTVELYGVP